VSGAEQALATLRDYVERSTHWREGGADRHSALLALRVLEEERCLVCGKLAEACGAAHADDDGRCLACGEDGGTSCGMPNCGLLA
jgi:hypothetical protein